MKYDEYLIGEIILLLFHLLNKFQQFFFIEKLAYLSMVAKDSFIHFLLENDMVIKLYSKQYIFVLIG